MIPSFSYLRGRGGVVKFLFERKGVDVRTHPSSGGDQTQSVYLKQVGSV